MSDRLLDAYYAYCLAQVRAGIIDHSLDAAVLEGKSVDEHVVEVLRAAGRLPDGWDREAGYRGLHLTTVTGDHWRIRSVPLAATGNPVEEPMMDEQYIRLRRVHRGDAA
jgi:hypothetical protein